MMGNIDKQKLIISTIGILVIGGFFVFRYVPIIRQKYAVQKQMQTQETVMDEICSQSARIPELKQQYDELSGKLEDFEVKVPKGRNFARLWQQIADVMNECKLSDQLVQPGQELKSDALCSIPLSIECKGSLEQIFTFFQSLESFDRLIRIQEIKLENDASYNSLIKLCAKASVYYQSDDTNTNG